MNSYECTRNVGLYPKHILESQYSNYIPNIANVKQAQSEKVWHTGGKDSTGTYVRPTKYLETPDQCYYKHSIYHPECPNPFIESGGACEWSSNYMLLKDQNLRYKAGVSILDTDITHMYRSNPKKSEL